MDATNALGYMVNFMKIDSAFFIVFFCLLLNFVNYNVFGFVVPEVDQI